MRVNSVTVVGGGNGAHALAALAANQGLKVRIWAPLEEERERLCRGVVEQGGIEAVSKEGKIKGRPAVISSDPAEVIPESQVIILVLPAFAHREMLLKMQPYLSKKSIVGAMPSRSGFEFAVRSILGESAAIFGLQTLPWACRIRDYGRQVEILGTKTRVAAAVSPLTRSQDISEILEEILGLPVELKANMLAMSLGNVGQIIHPGIMYGLFKDWNGRPFPGEKIPLFYQGVTEKIAGILEKLSREVLAVKQDLEEKGGICLEGVLSVRDWLLMSYAGSIEDRSTLHSCFNTNSGYRGLKAPVKPDGERGYVPDFTSRYLTEDVPYGLVVTRALAQLAGTPTPVIDEVIIKASEWMGKEYLVTGSLTGKDLTGAPIPQNYGINTISELVSVVS